MIRANQQCLGQAVRLLDLLGDAQYASPRGQWSAVGAQLRHVIEHYQCFLEGLDQGRIDYDARRRDPIIETSRERARTVLRELSDRIGRIPTEGVVSVQMRCAADAKDPTWSESSIGRELQFLVSHSVHHFALIKFLLAGDDLALDPDFGMAPSTLAHRVSS